jgi:sugar phosphate isomerase/epimerase
VGDLQAMVDEAGRLCLENTEAVPPEEVMALAERLGVGICLDLGHLFKAGLDPLPWLDGWLSRARVIHLHGWDGERDHRSLSVMPDEVVQPVVQRLHHRAFDGVVTLEVFSEADLLSSWQCLLQYEGTSQHE